MQFRNLDRSLLCGKKDLKRKVREGLAKGAKKGTARTQTAPLPTGVDGRGSVVGGSEATKENGWEKLPVVSWGSATTELFPYQFSFRANWN